MIEPDCFSEECEQRTITHAPAGRVVVTARPVEVCNLWMSGLLCVSWGMTPVPMRRSHGVGTRE